MWVLEITNPFRAGEAYLGHSGFVCDIAAARRFGYWDTRPPLEFDTLINSLHHDDMVRWVRA